VWGGGVPRPVATRGRDHQPRGKFYDKKGGLETQQFGIAHPKDWRGWVEQCEFVRCWFVEMWGRARGGDEVAGLHARDALQELLVRGCLELERVALCEGEEVAKWWAGRVLAYVGALVEADHGKLWEWNEAYGWERMELGRMLRNDLWFPGNPLYQALHRELWLYEFYRGEKSLAEARRYVAGLEEEMPEEYRLVLELPRFSAESWKEWNKVLWLLVKRHNPLLLEELRRGADRNEAVEGFGDGVRVWEIKSVRVSWKHVRTQFRNHLRAIALAEGGKSQG
jgi:hypothetical protein